MKKIAFFFALIVIFIIGIRWLYLVATAPSYRTVEDAPIDASIEPQQQLLANAEKIPFDYKGGKGLLTPLASFEINAKICGRKHYSADWHSKVAPYDLCLSWGKLATEDLQGKIRFKQDMRWYHVWVERDAPFDSAYVMSHSANVHVFYPDDNLRKAVSRLKVGSIVEMRGYLVQLEGTYKDQPVYWKSSLSRDDTGNGACEVFYLISLRQGDRLYGSSLSLD